MTSGFLSFLQWKRQTDMRQNDILKSKRVAYSPLLGLRANMRDSFPISLKSLLKRDGVQFLQSAYESLFGRQLDPSGQRTYLAAMRSGFSRIHVLYSLVHSPEGRSLGLSLPGLTRRYWLERMMPPAFIRRALGFHVPDLHWAFLFADLDALHARVQDLEDSRSQIGLGIASLMNGAGSSARLDKGTSEMIAQILHNSGESTRIAYEMERALSQMAGRAQVEAVTPRQASDLAYMLRASIARLAEAGKQSVVEPQATYLAGLQSAAGAGPPETSSRKPPGDGGKTVVNLGPRNEVR